VNPSLEPCRTCKRPQVVVDSDSVNGGTISVCGWCLLDQRDKLELSLREATEKWKTYEREYILPLFKRAREAGMNLEALVMENPGQNCVQLFAKHRVEREREAIAKWCDAEARSFILENPDTPAAQATAIALRFVRDRILHADAGRSAP